MLPPLNRMRLNADFQAVRQNGKRWRQGPLTLNAAPNGLAHSRIGFVINRAVGKAVVRNKLRRRLREVIRTHLGSLRPGYDLVLITYPGAQTKTFGELVELVGRLIGSAQLWAEENKQ